MCDQTIIQTFFKAVTAQDYESALTLLCDDFCYSGGTAVPLNRHQWVWVYKALATAMPDITVCYHFDKSEFGVVSGTWEIQGTQTADLTIPVPGIPKIPATGRRVVLPKEKIEIALEGNKIKAMRVYCSVRSSFSAIVDQMSMASSN